MLNPTETPARPPFKLSGVASVKHLNVRKQGPDDEKILAVDVKLSFSKVDRRLCAFFDESLEAFLWRGDTDALNKVAKIFKDKGVTVVEHGAPDAPPWAH